MRGWCAACFIALAGCGAATTSPVPMAQRSTQSVSSTFTESWSSATVNLKWQDGGSYGAWYDQYGGYGTIEVQQTTPTDRSLMLSPAVSTSPNETHAALVTTRKAYGNFDATVELTTAAQLRTPTPNPWEVGWVLWHYTDDSHFYSLNLKPNGWELGKEDPAYPGAQRYLRTGSSPTFPIGRQYAVRIVQTSATMTVYVNGVRLVSYTDGQRPYASGFLGLYCEDARVLFDDVQIASAA